MAVPKKKTSRSRRNSRRAVWKKRIMKHTLFALSIGKSLLKNKSNSFIYSVEV